MHSCRAGSGLQYGSAKSLEGNSKGLKVGNSGYYSGSAAFCPGQQLGQG